VAIREGGREGGREGRKEDYIPGAWVRWQDARRLGHDEEGRRPVDDEQIDKEKRREENGRKQRKEKEKGWRQRERGERGKGKSENYI